MLAYYFIYHYFYIKLYASITNFDLTMLFNQINVLKLKPQQFILKWHNNIHVVISTLC